jgi:hypothetical protein
MLAVALVAWGAMLLPRLNQTQHLAPGDVIEQRLATTSRMTLVAVLSSTCPFCTESMGFYKKLRAEYQQIPLVVASAEAPTTLKAYCESQGMTASRYQQVDVKDLRVPVTPSLLLVDERGVVRRTWFGRLSPQRERTVEQALQLASRP